MKIIHDKYYKKLKWSSAIKVTITVTNHKSIYLIDIKGEKKELIFLLLNILYINKYLSEENFRC